MIRMLFVMIATIHIKLHCLWWWIKGRTHREEIFRSKSVFWLGSFGVHYFRTAVIVCNCGRVFYCDDQLIEKKHGNPNN